MKNKNKEISYWIPIDMWNLNELFTTESISPFSFYNKRNFGNPVNRNTQIIEDENNLVLFDSPVQNDILLNILAVLIDVSNLNEIKSKGKAKLKSYEYTKTIYFKKDLVKVIFSSKDLLNLFLNSSFMLLEVKTINKYKSEFIVDESIRDLKTKAFYQAKLISNRNEVGPYYDKAFNQIKGLIYGYLVGSIGSFDENEQNLLNELTTLKNSVAGVHTDIVLAEQYSNLWLINVKRAVKSCSNSYIAIFGKESDLFASLILRLEEIGKLNKLRFDDLDKQKSPYYKQEFERAQNELERAKRALHQFELNNEIAQLRVKLDSIKKKEENIGKAKGKKREYFKKDSDEYYQKQELKKYIEVVEQDVEYIKLKQDVDKKEEHIRDFQFGYTHFDTSITEQFTRISEYLNDLTKRASNYFTSKNNRNTNFPDISFKIKINELAKYYSGAKNKTTFEAIFLPDELSLKLSKDDILLISKTLSVLFQFPQGLLGSHSEQNILEIIKHLGEQLEENEAKKVLREYYLYRKGISDNFQFPENAVIANVIVFLMKCNGHEQINKLIVNKGVSFKEIAFLFYGAYVGFANMPKTFTNIIFDSENLNLMNYIDNYLFRKCLSS